MKKKNDLNQKNELDNIGNVMDIFRVLVEGGGVAIYTCTNGSKQYFVQDKNNKSNAAFSQEIYEGLLSRGLLTLSSENIHEDFIAQYYALRKPQEEDDKE